MGSLCLIFNPRGRGTFQVLGREGEGGRVLGTAGYAMTIGGTGLAVGRKRFFMVVKLSNDNGSALLHYVGQLVGPAGKRMLVGKASVATTSSGRLLRVHHQRVTVIFRGFNLLPRHDILDGVTFNLRLRKIPGRRHRGGTVGDVRVIKLGKCRGRVIKRLSNKVRRHIKLTHTLTGSPRVLLVSRTFSTLSPLVHMRVRSRVLTLRSGVGGAVIFVARSLDRTVGLNSHVTVVESKRIIRIKASRRVLARPTGSCITEFMRGISQDGVVATKDVVVAHPTMTHLHGRNPRILVEGVGRESVAILPIVSRGSGLVKRVALRDTTVLQHGNVGSVRRTMRDRMRSIARSAGVRSLLPLVAGAGSPVCIMGRRHRLGNLIPLSSVMMRVAKGSGRRVGRLVRGTVRL